MGVVEQIKEVDATFDSQTPEPEELARLREFYERMKREGVATTRKYDLPQLDTIGRMASANGGRGAG